MSKLPKIGSTIDLACAQMDSWYWAYTRGIELVPGPFSVTNHQFQVRPMSVRPPIKVVRKARQFTFTESEVLDVLHGMIHGVYPVGVYYLFPSKDKVGDFSRTRFNPLIAKNPKIIGSYVKDTDSIGLKRIGNAFLYFKSGRLAQEIRGDMKTSASLKGDPCDHAVFDEYDEMIPCEDVDSYVDSAMSHSPVKTKHYLANPTLPDYGISSKFEQSSQEYWMIQCEACNAWTCMDDEDLSADELFSKRIVELSPDNVIRACSKCGKPVDPRNGEWVAKKPHITETLGFTIGHPSAPWIDPKALLYQWRETKDKANFIRLRLGRPYIEAENRLTISEVLACCGWDPLIPSDKGPCSMGIDQGGTDQDLFHIVIGKKHPVKAGKIIHLGVYKGWEELDRLMGLFRVSRCVIDGLPNQEAARKFAYRFPGKVYLSYFNENQKGAYKWNEGEYTVTSNRTEALDESHNEIMGKRVLLPQKCDIVEKVFAPHCSAIAKKLEEDEVTGSKKYVYIRLNKKDHFRFAFNYESMARNGEPAWLLPELR